MLDLDGVLWRGRKPIPGSAEAVARLRAAGHRVGFLTNNSFTTVAELAEKLAGMGVPVEATDICSSAQAAAGLLEPGSTALVVGGGGITEALLARGVEPRSDGGPVDSVVVGFDPEFDYAKLTAAFKAVRGGARLVGTNEDATFPTATGEIPGGGTIVAAVAYASGVTPEIAGKPHPAAARLLSERMGVISWLIGDRLDTDGGMAAAVGARFGLVMSGVTRSAEGASPSPDAVAPDLSSIVEVLVGLDDSDSAS